MSSKKLEIFRLGRDGEIQRTIVCLGGRVTVFRANREALLEEFRVALRARVPVSLFRIAIDGRKFLADEHCFIGFDEKFDSNEGLTVSAFLAMAGIVGTDLARVLAEFELEGLDGARVVDLGDTQQRIIRMLAATTKASGQVITLNDPFEGLSTALQEKLATRIADFAYQATAIVIITRLSARPESWIDNPLIVRVQLERPRRETIGAGSVFELDPLPERPQSYQIPTPARGLTSVNPPQQAAAQKPIPQASEKRASSATHSAVKPAVKTAVKPGLLGKIQKPEKPFTIALAAAYILVIAALPWIFGKGTTRTTPKPRPQIAVATPIPTPTPPQTGFRGLPQGIQEQVVLAFRDPDALLRSIPVNLKRRTPEVDTRPRPAATYRPEPTREEPPRFLAENPASFSPPNSYDGSGAVNNEELERRREEIRQRLLQAIMLRRQQMMQQQMTQ